MSIWDKIRAFGQSAPAQVREGWHWLGRTRSGIYVNEDVALKYGAVWSCIRVISESLASMPRQVYSVKGDGMKERKVGSRIENLLNIQPNPEMTSFDFFATITPHILLYGNGFAEIERDVIGRPVYLWPITPDRVQVKRDKQTSRLYYEVSNENGPDVRIEPINMLHFKGLGFDGLKGYSVVSYAAESIGTGLAMDEFSSGFFGNGSTLSGALTHPGALSLQAKERLRDQWTEAYSGSKKAFRTVILEEGMKYDSIGIPPGDAQLIQQRKFQINDICRWFRVPPHKLYEIDQGGYNKDELQSLEFVQDTLVPWSTRIEQEVNIKLFGEREIGKSFLMFNFDSLLRGNAKDRAEYYRTMRNMGAISANEIRSMEGLNPVGPEGDVYVIQGQYMSLESLLYLDPGEATMEPQGPNPQISPEEKTEEPEEPEEANPSDQKRKSYRTSRPTKPIYSEDSSHE